MTSRRVLITGASSGIGLATALRFARQGAHVALLARNERGLAVAAALVRAAGGRSLELRADVTDHDALRRAFERASGELGGLDVVVANVGAAAYGRFEETPAEDFRRVIEVTLLGNVDTIREALPLLKRSRGSLVVTGSAAADVPMPLMSAYTAAKYAMRGFVDALGAELRASGSPVHLALVEPGPVDTPFWVHVASEDGGLPPSLPFAYDPDEVALAIVRAADRRSERTTVGALMLAARAARGIARPLADRVLARASALARSSGAERRGTAAIWNPSGEGRLHGGIGGRPSLLVRGATSVRGAAAALGGTLAGLAAGDAEDGASR
jgi:NAD(P)-dependent dehydrogenase (short-subunit alcohol dehydrogenase family)